MMVRCTCRIWPTKDVVQSLETPPLTHSTNVLPGSGSDLGVFVNIMNGLAAEAPDNKTISMDATYLKAHRTASSLRLKKGGVKG